MLEDDHTYYSRRAQSELAQAQRSRHSGAAAAHRRLAQAFLERAASFGGAAASGASCWRRSPPPPPLGQRSVMPDSDLLLREINHRCGNDLQLVVSLLGLQSLRTRSDEARAALKDAADRVAVLARARAAITQGRTTSIESALRDVCEALQAQAEPRSILISFKVEQATPGLSIEAITKVALVVNELMINAIKHAFREGVAGHIAVTLGRNAGGGVVITVDDDGLPFPEASTPGGGLGLGLVKRLMASVDGLLIMPVGPGKVFELRIPSVNAQVSA